MRLEVNASSYVSETELDSGLVSEMCHADAAYPLSMSAKSESTPETHVATAINGDIQRALSMYT